MSLINLLLSSREVVLSLFAIGLILFIIVLMVVAPIVHRRLKERKASKRAQKAAKLARSQKLLRSKQRANAAPLKRPLETMMEQIAPPDNVLQTLIEETPSETPVEIVAATVEEAPVEISSSLQEVLDSVFMDDDTNSRFEILLKDVTPVSAEELVDLAASILSGFKPSEAEGAFS